MRFRMSGFWGRIGGRQTEMYMLKENFLSMISLKMYAYKL